MGSEEYYVLIPDGKPAENESAYWRYNYVLTGYAESGIKKVLVFDSFNPLKPRAYLRVYVRDGDNVISWEEVTPNEIPYNVRQRAIDGIDLTHQ